MLKRRCFYRDRPANMDPLSEILTLLRPTDYGFRGLDAGGDWLLDFDPAEGLRCFAIEHGSCWLDGPMAPTLLRAGDVVLLAANRALRLYSTADAAATNAHALFLSVPPGEMAVLNGGGDCRGVGGYFAFEGNRARVFLDAVPSPVHIRSRVGKTALVGAIARLVHELRHPAPGSALLARHLAQEMLIEALRALLAEAPARVGWLAALGDPQISAAVAAMHGDPAERWTLEALAKIVGISRSVFAERFRTVTGQTAMDYLARWRMTIAAERLRSSTDTVGVIAIAAGYDSEAAFGAAFKRVMGTSPRRFAKARRRQSLDP